jgi:hypothetical protein
MNIRELIAQESQVDIPKMFSDFLPIAMNVLKINKLPKIHLSKQINDQEQPTFGGYVDSQTAIHLAIANRHPNDILRTLAHELVHFKQHMENRLGEHSGETGSPEENEANQVAGIIMRYFNKKYPNYLGTKPLELDEHKKGVRAKKYNKKPKTIEVDFDFTHKSINLINPNCDAHHVLKEIFKDGDEIKFRIHTKNKVHYARILLDKKEKLVKNY